MTTLNDLERKRISKLKTLDDKEMTAYVDSLVGELYKYSDMNDLDMMQHYGALLDELVDLFNDKYNMASVVMEYSLFYSTSYNILHEKKKQLQDLIWFVRELSSKLNNLITNQSLLSRILDVYYKNYTNKGAMNMLLNHLSIEEKVKIPDDVWEKALDTHDIVENKVLMLQLDNLVSMVRDLIIEDMKEVEVYLKGIDDLNVQNRIKLAYEEIESINKTESCRLLKKNGVIKLYEDKIMILKVLPSIKENTEELIKMINKMLDDGFEEIVANTYEFNKKNYPLIVDGISKEEFIANEPKYDIMNAKFIKS